MTTQLSSPFRGIFLPLVLAVTVQASAEGTRSRAELASNLSDRNLILEPATANPAGFHLASSKQDLGALAEPPVRFELAGGKQDFGALAEPPVRFELAGSKQDFGALAEPPVRFELAGGKQDFGALAEPPVRFELAGGKQDSGAISEARPHPEGGFSDVTIRDLGKRYAQNRQV